MLPVLVSAAVLACPLFVAFMMWRALRRGAIQVGAKSIARGDQPQTYWLLVGGYALCALISVIAALFLSAVLILNPAP
jgi:hypothetical protein